MQSREGSLGQKLITNTLFNFLGQAYVLVLTLAAVPYVVHRLGPGLYGVLVMVTALSGFASLLNLGIGTALAKYVSELYWQRDFARIRALFQTALGTSLFAGVVGCLILIGPRDAIVLALFHGEPGVDTVSQFALYMAGLGLLLSLLTESLSALPIGLQRFEICNRMNVLLATLRNLGAVLALALGLYVKAVLLVHLFANLVGLLGYAYYGRRLVPGLSVRPKFTWADFKRLVSFSGFVLVAAVGGLVVHRLDRVLVAYFLPLAAVAFYAVPYSLAERIPLGVANITSVIFPSASELSAKQDEERLRELYLRATKMALLAGLPVSVILLAVPGQILQLWVGTEFAVKGTTTLRFLAGGFLLNILAHVPFVVAQGIGRPWISAKYSLFNALVNLVLFVVMIPRYGILGAGMAFFLAEVLVMPFFIWEVNRILGVSWWSLVSKAYVRALLCGLVTGALLWALGGYAASLLRLVFCCLVALSAYALLALVGAIDQRERVGIFGQVAYFFRHLGTAVNV